ncbi:hypothetical protein KIPB_008068 [Kipferlia bialata]|uniref:Uncharacterized protein n=1 Tax=Kipferlia bialata TaxID=797122 RepID=A0A9K3GL53_9EUKA|nr:hypothetical protein KIPB_008068 [Kipferlia bialata]|eukprot:g8068.t1
MRDSQIIRLLTANLFVSVGFGAFGFITASVFEIHYGFSSGTTGIIMSIGPALKIYAGVQTHKLSAKAVARKYLFYTGLLGLVGNFIAGLGYCTAYWVIVVGMIASQFGTTWFIPGIQANLLVRGPKDAQSIIFALFYVTQCAGKAFGVAVLTLVQTGILGNIMGEAPYDTDSDKYRQAYGISAMLGFLVVQAILCHFPWQTKHIGLSEADRHKPGFDLQEFENQAPGAAALAPGASLEQSLIASGRSVSSVHGEEGSSSDI